MKMFDINKTTDEEAKKVLLAKWDEFVEEAKSECEEGEDFFADHKDADDIVSTFWFWLENWIAKDVGRVWIDE